MGSISEKRTENREQRERERERESTERA